MSESTDAQKAILQHIAECVQTGKADASTNIPSGSKGKPGVAEWVEKALVEGVPANVVIELGLLCGMQPIGKKFAANEIFVPEVLIAARAMHAGMSKLKPYLAESDSAGRGVFVIGTVKGDLHDIGKNLVSLILEGAGWKIVDLGADCSNEKFTAAVKEHPGCAVGLSALLTTTMVAMREAVQAIREVSPDTVILIGGAPVTEAFAQDIGATAYAAGPAAAVDILDRLKPAARDGKDAVNNVEQHGTDYHTRPVLT